MTIGGALTEGSGLHFSDRPSGLFLHSGEFKRGKAPLEEQFFPLPSRERDMGRIYEDK
jgi:hypothetical protein